MPSSKGNKKSDKSNKKANLPKEELAFLIENTKYSKQEIKEWYRRFLDECPNGELTKAQLTQMYAGLMPKEDPAIIVGHLFRIFDRDNSGSIDFSEFVMATDITSSGSPEEKLRWTFRMYDKDGSGTIEMSEMVEILETVYIMEGVMSNNMAKTRAKQIFNELDINGDGSLTCDEFIQGCMKDDDMVTMLKSNTQDQDQDPTSEDKTQKKNKKNKA
eukprot:14140.XXX_284354_282410_1 [CDS] Oithona nana genome sequencing.